jgi:hypothetical protein
MTKNKPPKKLANNSMPKDIGVHFFKKIGAGINPSAQKVTKCASEALPN